MSKTLKELSIIHYGKSPNGFRLDESRIPIYGTGGIYGWASEPLFDRPLIVVARKGTLGRPSFASGMSWVVDTAYAVIPQKDVDAKWLYYQISNYNLESLNEATGVPSISRDFLYRVKFTDTPYPEQRKIAQILTTLDNVIEKTEALIAKYQAIKQGMMHDLFTRGIDSSGSIRPTQQQAPDLYKQSELGWIPKDSVVKPLKEVAVRVVVGLALSTTHAYRERGVALIRNQNIRKGFFEDDEMLFLDPAFAALYPNKAARKNDVLTVRTGANVGDTALVPEKYVGCPTFTTLITSPDTSLLDPMYLVHYIVSKFGVFELNRLLVGGGKENLNVGEFVKLRVVLPPIESQALFVDALKTLENRLEVERTLLHKHKRQKMGLMQDLLTGKVRVKVDETEEISANA
jgi:type I restriction enzyme, S subunit